jgi:hypothetical protein
LANLLVAFIGAVLSLSLEHEVIVIVIAITAATDTKIFFMVFVLIYFILDCILIYN